MKNPVRGVLIDAKRQKVVECRVSSLREMQEAVGGYIEIAHRFLNEDTLFVDEEGLFKDYTYGFVLTTEDPDVIQMQLMGNAIVLGGTDSEGESLPAEHSLEYLRSLVRFFKVKEER